LPPQWRDPCIGFLLLQLLLLLLFSIPQESAVAFALLVSIPEGICFCRCICRCSCFCSSSFHSRRESASAVALPTSPQTPSSRPEAAHFAAAVERSPYWLFAFAVVLALAFLFPFPEGICFCRCVCRCRCFQVGLGFSPDIKPHHNAGFSPWGMLSPPHPKRRHLDRRRRTLPPQWRDPRIGFLLLPLSLLLLFFFHSPRESASVAASVVAVALVLLVCHSRRESASAVAVAVASR